MHSINSHHTGGIFGGIRRSIERRQLVKDLSRLDDHLLRDIGLHRGDIYTLARGERP